MTHLELRDKYFKFWQEAPRNHVHIHSSSLVPDNDPTTLFTGSGMQPLIPYLLGQPHPLGTRLVDIQKCFRGQDIEEVGDNRHDTFFEMYGNWSLGDYFKNEQLSWYLEYLTKVLSIPLKKLHVSCFKGSASVPKDEESEKIWKSLGIPENRIHYYDFRKNWWSRSGTPSEMPVGEIGGPDSEVFYDFGQDRKIHETSKFSNDECHPNCDCGRFLEIGNSVFIQYQKQENGDLTELSQKNVDFGGGFERTLSVLNDNPDFYLTDIHYKNIQELERISGKKYGKDERVTLMFRVIADHIKSSVFLISEGVRPSNVDRGYILRRLIRRSIRFARELQIQDSFTPIIADSNIAIYKVVYPELLNNQELIKNILREEEDKFRNSLAKGMNEIEKITPLIAAINKTPKDIPSVIMKEIEEVYEVQKTVDFLTKNSFFSNLSLLATKEGVINTFIVEEQRDRLIELYQLYTKNGGKPYSTNLEEIKKPIIISKDDETRFRELINSFRYHKITLNSYWAFKFITTYGVPIEILQEIMNDKGLAIDTAGLEKLINEHRLLSRSATEGKFKGGLADHSEIVTRYHSATHLLQAGLRKVLGPHIRQEGSNLTAERLRFDFSHGEKLTPEQVKAVEDFVNEQIEKNLVRTVETMDYNEALKKGALAFFKERYPDKVTVYTFSDSGGNVVSREICGGPHVEYTLHMGKFHIIKEESVAAGIRRIYGKLD